MQRESDDYAGLISDEAFLRKILDTLRLWNMDQRGAKLVSFDEFKQSVQDEKENLLKLHNYKLHNTSRIKLQGEIRKILEPVFLNLRVMKSKRRLVGVSKALHFLLPDLVIPIDNKYTLAVIYYSQKYSNDPKKEFVTFMDVLVKAYEITRGLCLSPNDVSHTGWDTAIPKLLDNAFIGFCKFFIDSGRDVETSFNELQKQFPDIISLKKDLE